MKLKNLNFKKLTIKAILMILLALVVYAIGEFTYNNYDVLTYTILQPDKVRLMKNYQTLKLNEADQEFKQMFEIIEEL